MTEDKYGKTEAEIEIVIKGSAEKEQHLFQRLETQLEAAEIKS